MTRVLLAEDDAAIAVPLARALGREGYDVRVAGLGAAALVAAREGVDLVVLDLGLPDLDGVEVCRQMRAEGMVMPVLVLTARAEEVDTVVGLDAGADDYVTKPFRLAELLARVRALLRRGEQTGTDAVLQARGVRLDTSSRRVWLVGGDGSGGQGSGGQGAPDGAGSAGGDSGDVELVLAAKEFDLLHVLMREAGTVVPREKLMEEVWGPELLASAKTVKSTKTLDMHVSWLRRKLGDDISAPRWIATVRGVGFRFERD